jgi:SAM-dependent methyltransferase
MVNGERVLCCPNCGGALEARSRAFVCSHCHAAYPVVNRIPRFLIPGAMTPQGRRTARSFAYEWRRFGELRPEWERNFREYLRPLDPAELRGQRVLDVGAGSGRHSYYAAAAGAIVTAVDVGDAIEVARRNLPAEVLTVQADAERLPFADGSFDLVMSIGVLHHLPDPPRALQKLVRLVRPGGRIHVYLYWVPEQRWHRVVLGWVAVARRLTTRLPHRVLHLLCFPLAGFLELAIVIPYRLLRDRQRWQRIAEGLPLKAYADYPFAVLVNDQFDRLSAPIEHRYTRTQVQTMMADAGLEEITVIANHGWIADGRRRPQGDDQPASDLRSSASRGAQD